MTRFLLKLSTIFTLLFALCIALIRAQPYDDSKLRAFLTPPEGCIAPCFMGIRPGVTTGYDALELLRTNRWVHNIQSINVATGTRTVSGSIRWEWSGRQPAWIDPRLDSWIWTDENRVEYVAIHTSVSVSEIWLTYGAPATGTVSTDTGTLPPRIYYEAFYPRQYMFVTVYGVCPFRNYWLESTLITFRHEMPPRQETESSQEHGLPGSFTSQCTELLNWRGMPSP